MSKTYEMFWDCDYCGSTKLLGKSHRYCPNCGAAQDSEKRYFPEEEEKIAVEDHEYVGADKICEACGSANAAIADFCVSCGSGMGESKSVDLQPDSDKESEPPPEPPKSMDKSKLKMIIGVVVALIIFLIVLFTWKEEKGVQAIEHTWERSVQVEEYKQVTESDWQDNVPIEATSRSCNKKERGTKKIQSGEECKTVNKDNGDGTYRQEKKCTPKYVEEPVFDQYCSYQIKKWKKTRDVKANGVDLNPVWPETKLNVCTLERLGCERKGKKTEKYTVHLKDPENTVHKCDYAIDKWKSIEKNTNWKMEFRKIGGGAVCDSIKK